MREYYQNNYTGFITEDIDEMKAHCYDSVPDHDVMEILKSHIDIEWLDYLPDDIVEDIMNEASEDFFDDYVEYVTDYVDEEEEEDEEEDEKNDE